MPSFSPWKTNCRNSGNQDNIQVQGIYWQIFEYQTLHFLFHPSSFWKYWAFCTFFRKSYYRKGGKAIKNFWSNKLNLDYLAYIVSKQSRRYWWFLFFIKDSSENVFKITCNSHQTKHKWWCSDYLRNILSLGRFSSRFKTQVTGHRSLFYKHRQYSIHL